jgi:hypothetical protein
MNNLFFLFFFFLFNLKYSINEKIKEIFHNNNNYKIGKEKNIKQKLSRIIEIRNILYKF